MGIPVSCEVDIYGALSEFIGTVVSEDTVTLLDINNTVPSSIFEKAIKGRYNARLTETFMGFHCGNTPACKLSFCEMRYQKIMARSLPKEFTNGTLEGDIAPGDITFFRLQSRDRWKSDDFRAGKAFPRQSNQQFRAHWTRQGRLPAVKSTRCMISPVPRVRSFRHALTYTKLFRPLPLYHGHIHKCVFRHRRVFRARQWPSPT